MARRHSHGLPKQALVLEPDTSPAMSDSDTTAETEAWSIVSKSQRKREARALQTLGMQLVALPPGRLARLELPEGLREAVRAAQGMHQHGARLRQMQYIGRLMRQLEPAELQCVCEALDPARAGLPRANS